MNYREKINRLLDRQDAKGMQKYGCPLEANPASIYERLQHSAEEQVDNLRYTLWAMDALEKRMQVKIKLLSTKCRPYRRYGADAGFDLRANSENVISVSPGCIVRIPTGVCLEIPIGHFGSIRGRSGLTSNGVFCPCGTVDSGYTGEIHVVLINMSDERYVIQPWERVAQLIIVPLSLVELVEVDVLSESERKELGFGSTGRV
ncbi:MAG: dUTP diphosphatase [Firmicutes bacterium]|nr:dUTP diphosphatase [Bacillota bacterium]